MDEFIARIGEADEAISRHRGDDAEPLNAQMKQLFRQMKNTASNRKFA